MKNTAEENRIDYYVTDEIARRLETLMGEAVTWDTNTTGIVEDGLLVKYVQYSTTSRRSGGYRPFTLSLEPEFIQEIVDSFPSMGDTCTWLIDDREGMTYIKMECNLPCSMKPHVDLNDPPPPFCRACGRKLLFKHKEKV